MSQVRYLRFARALALAAIVPGCSGATPAPAPQVAADADTRAAQARGDASSDGEDASGDVDAGLPFSSGPIVPPELPAGFA